MILCTIFFLVLSLRYFIYGTLLRTWNEEWIKKESEPDTAEKFSFALKLTFSTAALNISRLIYLFFALSVCPVLTYILIACGLFVLLAPGKAPDLSKKYTLIGVITNTISFVYLVYMLYLLII